MTYDPATFPSCENAFGNAKATARFDGGRGNELLIQVKMRTCAAYICAMRKSET